MEKLYLTLGLIALAVFYGSVILHSYKENKKLKKEMKEAREAYLVAYQRWSNTADVQWGVKDPRGKPIPPWFN